MKKVKKWNKKEAEDGTGTRRVFESLYLVSYGEEDKYHEWGSPRLLECFSGIEGGWNMLFSFTLSSYFLENDSVKSWQKD